MIAHSNARWRHWFAVVLVSGICLAIWAPAAQARPAGLYPSRGGWSAKPAGAGGADVRVATVKSDAGFSWVDGAAGAVVAVGILMLGRVALTRPRPRVAA